MKGKAMSIADVELQDLIKVTMGVLKEGGYFFLRAHPAIRQAICRCYAVHCTAVQVTAAIEAAHARYEYEKKA